MQSRRGDFHLLFVLLKIYQTFSTTNNKMISPNRKAYLFIIEEICNKDTGIFNMDVYNEDENVLITEYKEYNLSF